MTTDSRDGSALRQLQDGVTMWAVDYEDGASAIQAAAQSLADGFDTPSLRAVASLPLDAAWWPSEDELRGAFDELHLAFPEKDAPSTKLRALSILCGRALDGAISAQDLTEWAHSRIGHHFSDETEDLVVLDDDGDELPSRPDGWEASVLAAARKFTDRQTS